MRFEGGSIVRDQNGDSPGQYGDSCFDTFAFGLSHWFVYKQYHPQIDHKIFFTDKGTVRHPLSIWREDDMSEDNEKPLYVFCRETQNNEESMLIRSRLLKHLTTGNGKFITFGYLAELLDWQFLRCLGLLFQAIFFLLPYWDDGAWKNGKWPIGWLTKTDGYLQWALIANLAPWPFRKLIRKQTLKKKIAAYYRPEVDANQGFPTTHTVLVTHESMVDLL